MAKARADIAKDPEIRALKAEVHAAHNELKEAGHDYKKAVKAFAKETLKEVQFDAKRDYYNKAHKQLTALQKSKALERGPE
jgi:hypothetical protein